MTERPEISFIVVSYNTADLIESCLRSILKIQDCRMEVLVVDNASLDESVLVIEKIPDVHLLANIKNVGFGPANNQALPLCRGRYIFFLNPDTRVESISLQQALAFMDAHPEIGLAGVKILNPDGTDQESVSFSYPGQRAAKKELSGLPGSISWVLGAGMIARSEIINKLGGFDQDFFLYGEEQDLCLRIRKLGYAIGFCNAVTVTHFSGQSERTSGIEEIWRKKTAAEYLFYRKHYLPETIIKIIRQDLLKAAWRIATLKLLLLILRGSRRDQAKLVKYHVAWESAKKAKQKLKKA